MQESCVEKCDLRLVDSISLVSFSTCSFVGLGGLVGDVVGFSCILYLGVSP